MFTSLGWLDSGHVWSAGGSPEISDWVRGKDDGDQMFCWVNSVLAFPCNLRHNAWSQALYALFAHEELVCR